MAFLGGAWLPELSALVEGRTHIYVSSGNTTTGQPAATAAQAEAVTGNAADFWSGRWTPPGQ